MMAINDINLRMLAGNSSQGWALIEKIAHLAMVTDDQQKYMYQTVMLTPYDARCLLANLAAHGFVLSAVPKEETK